MHITIFVYGSWGDIRPHAVLGMALQERGHEVQLVASTAYETWVRERGLGFYPLATDVNTFAKENVAIMDESFLKQLQMLRKEFQPIFTQMGLETLEATRDSDVLITVEFGGALLFDVLRVNNLKPIFVNPAPISPTSEFASTIPPAPNWFRFPGWYNRMSYRLLHRVQWMAVAGARHELATNHLGLPKSKFRDYKTFITTTPALTSVSKHVVPRPADWDEHFQITGFLFDDDPDWTPPQDLTDFLAAGEAPIYIGFGSMPDGKPEATTHTLIEAVQRASKRAVILTGWAGFGVEDVPDNIHILKYAPHSWLFPQMAAVVHHGGSGTTASGMRAGVPTIIVPHQADQPFWGRLVEQLGVGTAPIPRKKLSAKKLAEAIQGATTSQTMRQNAQVLSEKIQQEDGLGEAVKWVERFLA